MAEPEEPQSVSPWLRLIRVRFFWLLASLVGFVLVAPALPNSTSGQWEVLTLSLLNFFAASYVSQGMNRIRAVILLALALILLSGCYFFLGYSDWLLVAMLVVVLITVLYTAGCVLSYVLNGGRVGTEHIFGAICAYVMIAMAFATLFFLLELLVPGSFSGGHFSIRTDRPWWEFLYFSFSTLSTVGYGDIVAITMRARSLVILEELVAVFYVAILISRLTGMYHTNYE